MSEQALTCQELVELVTEYFENSLSEVERKRFEAHLGTCSGCRNYLAQMKSTIDLTGKLSEVDVPPPARDELLNIFRNWKK